MFSVRNFACESLPFPTEHAAESRHHFQILDNKANEDHPSRFKEQIDKVVSDVSDGN